jgi:uncharacterized Zn-binding protein involved in type VI secretion
MLGWLVAGGNGLDNSAGQWLRVEPSPCTARQTKNRCLHSSQRTATVSPSSLGVASMMLNKALLTLALIAATTATVHAQSQTPAPGVVVQGSSDVQSGDLPAARAGDATSGGTLVEGSSDVFINGRPAGRLGDRTNCGVIVRGSSNVFINGKPMARVGDNTSGC